MDRRKLLKSLGLGLSAGLVLPEFLVSCNKPDPGPLVRFDGTVAIIGAGAAGLYAADILRSKGISIVVFEAGSAVGGRIKSYRAPAPTDTPTDSFFFIKDNPSIADFPLELGPEIIEGTDSIWGKIVKDLTIKTVDVTTPANRFILDNSSRVASEWSSDTDFNAVENFVGNLSNLTASGTSVLAASGVSGRGAALLNSQAGNWYGSSSDDIDAGALGAALALAKGTHDDKLYTLIGTLMQDILRTRFTNVATIVKFNTVVQSINYSADPIVITDSNGGTTSVQKVIVTVPLSVMKSGAISFSPGLPSAMTSSMAKLGMDSCIRLILDFKTNFWGDSTTGYIWGGTTCPQYFSAGLGRSDSYHTLTLTICGPKAAELSAMGSGMITPILAEMDAIYGGLATTNIRRAIDEANPDVDGPMIYTIQDWSKEPHIHGAFSYPMVGATADDRTAIGQSVNEKIFFAGEATDVTGNAGTVNGALASAERVAQEVIVSITGP